MRGVVGGMILGIGLAAAACRTTGSSSASQVRSDDGASSSGRYFTTCTYSASECQPQNACTAVSNDSNCSASDGKGTTACYCTYGDPDSPPLPTGPAPGTAGCPSGSHPGGCETSEGCAAICGPGAFSGTADAENCKKGSTGGPFENTGQACCCKN